MKLLARGKPFGVNPYYYRWDKPEHGRSIASLLGDETELNLDRAGLLGYLNRTPDESKTVLANIRKVPPGHSLYEADGKLILKKTANAEQSHIDETDPAALLKKILARIFATYSRPVLALSGGLDSALLLSLALEIAGDRVEACTLATEFPDYCELEQTQKTADHLGVPLRIFHAGPEDFVDALPAAIRAAESPLYNLHPVSKLLIFQKGLEVGYDCIITGDGADQAFAGRTAHDYLSITSAMARHTGIGYESPFFEEALVELAATLSDNNKTALRNISAPRLPTTLVQGPKKPRLAPPFEIAGYRNDKIISDAAGRLNLKVQSNTEYETTIWTTTGILLAQFQEALKCAV